MIITDSNGNSSSGNGNERENVHPDFCGEHPPALIPMSNSLSGKTEVLAVRAQCVRQCSRFCNICDCCKFKCGHVAVIDSNEDEYDDGDEEEDFGLGDEIFDAGKN